MEQFDAVIVGSGHNALITAAYLARAGWSVLVLEQNDRPGGLVRTEELTLPGFKHDVFSAAHPLFVTGQAYADLGAELTARGLRYLNTDLPTGVSMADGQTAVFSQSMEATIAEAERLAPGDGAALGGMLEAIGPYANDVFSLFSMDLASKPAGAIIGRLLGNPDGPGYSPFAAALFQTARTVVSPFRSPAMQAMLAPWVMHLGRTPDEVGSGVWVPLLVMALLGGGMALPEGGSERLAQALASLVTDHGGTIRTGARVTRIRVERGRATGVETADGEAYGARRAVVASVNPDQLYLKLLEGAEVPSALRRQASQFRYGRGAVQIQLALSEPPAWPDERFRRIGQPHLSSGLDACTLAIAQGMAGLLAADPTFTVDCPTSHDPTRAPAGKAIVRVQVLEVPCRPRGDAAGQIEVGDGAWDEDVKQRFAERIIGIVGRHIPNIPSAILGTHIVSPAELARFSPNLGPGDPYGGAHDLAQSYLFRPLPGQPGHQSSVPNVYMLGAGTWPGHGVNGGSGYIVAQALLSPGHGQD
ncbi:MAG TPA: NAD(P)/FAD-dependent oxidoreductase [Herpetosiphonaceae bacterium]|nr:NAD(P)/FAD-dependent oxidoreductase [Herpetosiphonaceae bacterium]